MASAVEKGPDGNYYGVALRGAQYRHALGQQHSGARAQRISARHKEPFAALTRHSPKTASLDKLRQYLEVLREHCGSFVRRVWCVHCDGYTENVTQRVFICPHCARTLVVRDHYSRRLAAFQAVKADAEVPGELPAAEELDT